MAQVILIPLEKIAKAQDLVSDTIGAKKIKLKKLQELCGTLNFLCKAVVPGRAFTRRLYAAGAGLTRPNHHLQVTKEMRQDLGIWQEFLERPQAYCWPFVDFSYQTPFITDFHTDASRNFDLGAGGHCGQNWFILAWNKDEMEAYDPSIDFLELYALTVGIGLWLHRFENSRIGVFCDNLGVVHMINSKSAKCKHSMTLIRYIVWKSIIHNVRVFAYHVPSRDNLFADLLSRHKYGKFREQARKYRRYFNGKPDPIPNELWPLTKVFQDTALFLQADAGVEQAESPQT